MVDASDTAIGAVCQQLIDGCWCPIAFYSKSLSPTEVKYSTFERELLATYSAVKHFRHFLEGRQFFILTDHKPLAYAIASHSAVHSPREIRQLAFISEFTTDIRFIKGQENIVADTLSRLHIDASFIEHPPLDYSALSASQKNDSELQTLLSSSSCSLELQEVQTDLSSPTLVCDVSTGQPRPYLTRDFRRQAFDILHSLAHPGIKSTQRLVLPRYVWPGMNSDVRRWTRACINCQRTKVHRHTVSPSATF